jgi:hypothetical protein
MLSMNRTRLALILSIGVAVLGRCNEKPDTASSNEPIVGKPVVTSPHEPVQFKDDREAARLMFVTERPLNRSAEWSTLSDHYKKNDYPTMAKFAEQAARVANTQPILAYSGQQLLRTTCSPEPSLHRATQRAYVPTGTAEAMLSNARKMRREMSVSCSDWLEWAETVRLATINGAATSPEERELAIRTLVTLAEDGGLVPAGVRFVSEVYFNVAQMLVATNELRGALVAAEMARVRSPEPQSQARAAELAQRLRNALNLATGVGHGR